VAIQESTVELRCLQRDDGTEEGSNADWGKRMSLVSLELANEDKMKKKEVGMG